MELPPAGQEDALQESRLTFEPGPIEPALLVPAVMPSPFSVPLPGIWVSER